jgi:hypothetical protein
MTTAHSLGRVFVCIGAPQAQGAPLVDRAFTRELDGPLRVGVGFLIRLPFMRDRPTRGIVIGVWRKPSPVHNSEPPPEQSCSN